MGRPCAQRCSTMRGRGLLAEDNPSRPERDLATVEFKARPAGLAGEACGPTPLWDMRRQPARPHDPADRQAASDNLKIVGIGLPMPPCDRWASRRSLRAAEFTR